jgi:hypothetical protein
MTILVFGYPYNYFFVFYYWYTCCEKAMAGSGSSMTYSFLLFIVILSLQEMYRGKLASSELYTILGGFISSLLFLVLLTVSSESIFWKIYTRRKWKIYTAYSISTTSISILSLVFDFFALYYNLFLFVWRFASKRHHSVWFFRYIIIYFNLYEGLPLKGIKMCTA